MLTRKPIFPKVLEVNYQLGEIIGCNVYVVYDQDEWLMIDIGYVDTVEEIIEMIRQLDFPLANCKNLIATHADVDHIQGLAQAKSMLRTRVAAHTKAAKSLSSRCFTVANAHAVLASSCALNALICNFTGLAK